jgi:DNA-binding NtrC family response regulator
VAAGAFREDLLYRIRVARVRVPPLRERLEDIPVLVDRMLARRSVAGRLVTGVSPEAMARLATYAWPGNVRELRSAIEHAAIHCAGHEIQIADLPPELFHPRDDAVPSPIEPEPVDERVRIVEALRRAGGNRSRAARMLGIGRATLYRRLDELGLDPGVDDEPGPGRPS